MADEDTSVSEATDDTSVSEVAEPSTNEESQATDDQSLEEIEVSPEDIGSEETEESEESDKAEAESETEETPVVDEEPSGEVTPSEDDKQQQARAAFIEREAKRQADKSKAQSDYLEGAEDDKDLALRQLQIDAYNNKVESNINKLQNGIDRAVAGIDLFREGSPEAQNEMANSLDDFERMYVKRDQNGDPIDVTGDVYQYLQNKADSIRRLTGIGARQQQTNKANQKARTLTPPAKTPKAEKKDPDMEAFDEEASKY